MTCDVEFLRDCTMEMLQEAKAEISEEDYMRAEYVIEEIQRVLDVCDALERLLVYILVQNG